VIVDVIRLSKLANTEQKASSNRWLGFLTIGTLWGIAVGYLVADIASGSRGLLWHYGSSQGDQNFNTRCLVGYSFAGFTTGLLADLLPISDNMRTKICYYAFRLGLHTEHSFGRM